MPNMEIRVAVIGNVDSGKSTLVGVLTRGMLDDGRGLARSKVMRLKACAYIILPIILCFLL